MEPKGSLPCSPMNVMLRQMNPVHTLILYFFNAHFNIILHVNLDLPSDFSFLIKTLYAYLACLMRVTSRPAHLPLLDYPDNIILHPFLLSYFILSLLDLHIPTIFSLKNPLPACLFQAGIPHFTPIKKQQAEL
jgi:hypothetical protein